MPTPTKGPRLGGGPAHQRRMLANLSLSLFEHKSIKTTLTKAKRLQPYAERLITHAKKGDLSSRRTVQGLIAGNSRTNKSVVHELFTVIGPAMAQREGGYTRITKIGNRSGDNAPMAVIELVMEPVSPKQAVVAEAEGVAEAASEETATEATEADETQTEDTAAAGSAEETEEVTEDAEKAEEEDK